MRLYLNTGVVFIVLIISGCSDTEPSQPPSDQDLIQLFNNNKQVFITLKDKFSKDGFKVISIDPEWCDPKDIPLDTKKEYYRLLKQVNIAQIRSLEKDTVVLAVWDTGNVSGGDSKGYIYKPSTDWPREEKESLDNMSLSGEEFYKRRIDGDWCLYYDHFL